ncbi:MAG: hypothetical protein ACOC9P_02245 [bacterium]
MSYPSLADITEFIQPRLDADLEDCEEREQLLLSFLDFLIVVRSDEIIGKRTVAQAILDVKEALDHTRAQLSDLEVSRELA